MDEVLTATLRRTVVDRPGYLDILAAGGNTPSKAALAEKEIARLTTA